MKNYKLIGFITWTSFLFSSFESLGSEVSCSKVFSSQRPGVSSTSYTEKLFESITTANQLQLADGSILKFEDDVVKNKISTKLTFPETSWKGLSEFRKLDDHSVVLDTIVLPFEGSPKWINTKENIGIDPNNGTPTSLYLLLRSLKKLGVKRGKLKELTVEKIRHPQTAILMASLMRDWHHNTKKVSMKVQRKPKLFVR